VEDAPAELRGVVSVTSWADGIETFLRRLERSIDADPDVVAVLRGEQRDGRKSPARVNLRKRVLDAVAATVPQGEYGLPAMPTGPHSLVRELGHDAPDRTLENAVMAATRRKAAGGGERLRQVIRKKRDETGNLFPDPRKPDPLRDLTPDALVFVAGYVAAAAAWHDVKPAWIEKWKPKGLDRAMPVASDVRGWQENGGRIKAAAHLSGSRREKQGVTMETKQWQAGSRLGGTGAGYLVEVGADTTDGTKVDRVQVFGPVTNDPATAVLNACGDTRQVHLLLGMVRHVRHMNTGRKKPKPVDIVFKSPVDLCSLVGIRKPARHRQKAYQRSLAGLLNQDWTIHGGRYDVEGSMLFKQAVAIDTWDADGLPVKGKVQVNPDVLAFVGDALKTATPLDSDAIDRLNADELAAFMAVLFHARDQTALLARADDAGKPLDVTVHADELAKGARCANAHTPIRGRRQLADRVARAVGKGFLDDANLDGDTVTVRLKKDRESTRTMLDIGRRHLQLKAKAAAKGGTHDEDGTQETATG